MRIDKELEELFFPIGSNERAIWDALKLLEKSDFKFLADFDPETQKINIMYTTGSKKTDNIIYLNEWRKK